MELSTQKQIIMNKLLIILSISFFQANSQSTDSIQIFVNKTMLQIPSEEIAARKVSSFPPFIVKDLTFAKALNWIDILKAYENSENYFVRDKVYSSYLKIASNTSDSNTRQLLVNRVLTAFRDTLPVSNIIPKYAIFEKICKEFTTMQVSDFDTSARNKIISIVQKRQYLGKNIFLIIGWLNLKQATPLLKAIFKSSENNVRVDGLDNEKRNYEIQMALARMGEEESVKYICSYFEKLRDKYDDYFTLNDLINDKNLSYIKRPEILTFLTSFLDRKESVLGGSSGEQIDMPRYIACNALGLLEIYYPDLEKWLIVNNYFDKSIYQASLDYNKKNNFNSPPLKVRSCEITTYNAAQNWILQNKNNYKFNVSSFY